MSTLTIVVLAALPALAFWVHLGLWASGLLWSGPGEDWSPVIIQYGLFLFCLVISILVAAKGIHSLYSKSPSNLWWIAAAINLSPVLLVVVIWLYGSLNNEGSKTKVEEISVAFRDVYGIYEEPAC